MTFIFYYLSANFHPTGRGFVSSFLNVSVFQSGVESGILQIFQKSLVFPGTWWEYQENEAKGKPRSVSSCNLSEKRAIYPVH